MGHTLISIVCFKFFLSLFNSSLTALGKVIMALDPTLVGRQHVPYRDSKLTRLLQNSLGKWVVVLLLVVLLVLLVLLVLFF